MSLIGGFFFLGSMLSAFYVFDGMRRGRIAARFGVFADRKDDPFAFWLVASLWALSSLALLFFAFAFAVG
jgi:hypothetical protein